MKTKQQKQASFKQIKDRLARAKIAIFSSFSQAGAKGLNVASMRELRKVLRPLESDYVVEKKTVLDKAVSHDVDVFRMPGSLGVAYGYGDPYATAKALLQFAKKNPALKLFGGLMGDAVIDMAAVIEMAMMPSKEALIGRLVGMLSYPMRSLAIVLNQIKHESR